MKRKTETKGIRLLAAVLWTVYTGIWTAFLFMRITQAEGDASTLMLTGAAVVVGVAASIIYWTRHVTFMKISEKDNRRKGP